MREICGDAGEPEYEAAQLLDKLIVEEWGELPEPLQKVSIITAAQTPGQKVHDIDLLLLVRFKTPLPVRIPAANELSYPSEVHVKSLCVTIEIKDHSADAVDLRENGEVRVRYPNHWHNASGQCRKQVYALKGYLESLPEAPVPFIAGVVWLRGYPQADLPAGVHNVVGMGATWPHFVRAVLSRQHSFSQDGFELLNSAREPGDITRVRNIFARPIRPSLLDRRKLEVIGGQAVAPEMEALRSGERQIVFRGRGGTGKTLSLLHMAYQKYIREQQRTLFLTYNIALAADVERLLTIRGVRDQVGGRSIRVETIQTFIGQVLRVTGLLSDDEDFVGVYADRKRALLTYLSDPDLSRAVREESDLLIWDFVCVDEAQDCPVDERDILHRLFSPERCVIADGIDQMVRSAPACDWQPTSDIRAVTQWKFLNKSLRLQHGLCRFVNAVAQGMGLDNWNLEPNPDLPGGRIIITTERDFPSASLYDRVATLSREYGNDTVDLLFCVPNTLVDQTDELAPCLPARAFVAKGRKVWDGTRPHGRKIPILDNDLHRFVQYESCRGLEGWATFLFSLDTFYETKLWHMRQAEPGESSPSEHVAMMRAAEWLMIPLTRCISTLVVHLDQADSTVGRLFIETAARFSDFVEVIEG